MSSRVGRKPIDLPNTVQVKVEGSLITIKGSKGELTHQIPSAVSVNLQDEQIQVSEVEGAENTKALVGTTRALLNNKVVGVTQGFEKKLQLVGVGYRAQSGNAQDGRKKLDLTLGLSHPVTYAAPKGIELQTPSNTEIVVSGICKQLVGQVAADIRGICGGVRKPEPYKGKGIRYANEQILLKETKKK